MIVLGVAREMEGDREGVRGRESRGEREQRGRESEQRE